MHSATSSVEHPEIEQEEWDGELLDSWRINAGYYGVGRATNDPAMRWVVENISPRTIEAARELLSLHRKITSELELRIAYNCRLSATRCGGSWKIEEYDSRTFSFGIKASACAGDFVQEAR